jgi:FkbM family methyltransferase
LIKKHQKSVQLPLINFLKSLRRHYFAIVDKVFPVSYYSQFGEDRILSADVTSDEIRNGIYIDVGSNHPSRISNSYRFYRLGSKGFLVEPNPVFDRLYRYYRSRDTHLKIGISTEAGLLTLYDNGSTAVSGFIPSSSDSLVRGFFPVLPLDALLSVIDSKQIYLLSIDVEGMDANVLLSGSRLLQQVSRVIVEFGDEFEKIDSILSSHGFVLMSRNSTNGIYKRNRLSNLTGTGSR